jgi:sugar/nucleoside kinase (ribokinase family)
MSTADDRPEERAPGGGAVNAALALAARGLGVELCAAIGDDALGRELRRALRRSGVRAEARGLAGGRTGVVRIVDRGTGPRFEADRDGAWEARELSRVLPREPRVRAVLISGLLPNVLLLTKLARLVARCRSYGALCAIDANTRPKLWRRATPSARRAALALLHAADWVKTAPLDERMLEIDAGEVNNVARTAWVRTSGPEPVELRACDDRTRLDVARVVNVEAAGAGDVLTAAIVAALLEVDAEKRATKSIWVSAVKKGMRAAQQLLRTRE